jgi:hypothetical protein
MTAADDLARYQRRLEELGAAFNAALSEGLAETMRGSTDPYRKSVRLGKRMKRIRMLMRWRLVQFQAQPT